MLYNPIEEIFCGGEKGKIFSAFVGWHDITLVLQSQMELSTLFYFSTSKGFFSC